MWTVHLENKQSFLFWNELVNKKIVMDTQSLCNKNNCCSNGLFKKKTFMKPICRER